MQFGVVETISAPLARDLVGCKDCWQLALRIAIVLCDHRRKYLHPAVGHGYGANIPDVFLVASQILAASRQVIVMDVVDLPGSALMRACDNHSFGAILHITQGKQIVCTEMQQPAAARQPTPLEKITPPGPIAH